MSAEVVVFFFVFLLSFFVLSMVTLNLKNNIKGAGKSKGGGGGGGLQTHPLA